MKPKLNQQKLVPSQEGTVEPDKESSEKQEKLNEEWAERLPHEDDPYWED